MSSRKISAEKDNYNCIVYKKVMSIKLVLRYFKLFILFFTYMHSFNTYMLNCIHYTPVLLKIITCTCIIPEN